MTRSIQLDLVSGGRIELVLEEPDQFPSSYFVAMEHSGNAEFWQIVVKLLAAAKRSVCKVGACLRQQGLTRQDVTDSAMRSLLQTNGYAFGIFWDVDPALRDLDLTDHKTFIFVRDPRDLVVSSHSAMMDTRGSVPPKHPREAPAADRDSNSVALLDNVRSLDVDDIARRYRRFADFCRSAKNVTVFRYEDAMFSWRRLVVDMNEKLNLQISRESAFTIADSSKILADVSNITGTGRQDLPATFRERLDDATIANLEEKFAYPMAFFGYTPERSLPSTFLEHQAEFLRAVTERLTTVNAHCSDLAARVASFASPRRGEQNRNATKQAVAGPSSKSATDKAGARTDRVASRLFGLAEPDPSLSWRLGPNALCEQKVLGRRIVMEVDPTGCRPVVGQPQAGEKTLAVYGCSVTFGWAIAADETFCSLLQSMFPTWRIENHGVGGYSGTQNLIQLQRDSRWIAAHYVTFCWLPHHMLRNVADPTWLQQLMRRNKVREAQEGLPQNGTAPPPQTTFPRAFLDPDGRLQHRAIKFPRWDLLGIDWTDFSPDPYYLDLVCFGLFRRAAEIVKENGGHFFVTTLSGHLSTQLHRMLDDVGIPVVDASVDGAEYTCLPDDLHPNALANRIYAEKIRDYLVQRSAT
jgi:hypothetical protein